MRKTLCAFALTLILSNAALAGEIPNGKTNPPPPPPFVEETVGETPNEQALTEQTSDETVTDFLLNLVQSVLAIY